MEDISVNKDYHNKIKPIKSRRGKFIFCFLSTFLLFCALISPAAAEVDWKLTPTFPTAGDIIKIRGTSAPDEEIQGEISFEMDLPVSEGKYEYVLEDIQVPDGFNNLFTVRAEGVEDLHVGVKKFVWIDLDAEATNGIATISQGHVPPLSYMVVINGNALDGEDSVHLNFTASQSFEADSKGKFKYRYDTTSIPAGDFRINIGGSEQIIELKAKEKIKPIADFSASPVSGKVPLKVVFKDLSTGNPIKWRWSFGDGTFSTEKNPVHTYKKAGEYPVSLKVKNPAGSDKVIKPDYIVVKNTKSPGKPPVADFSTCMGSGETPFEIEFSDESTGSPVSWTWNFGDGEFSTEQNPVHIYDEPGKYTVTLKVRNSNGLSSETLTDYIKISKGKEHSSESKKK
ncbi:MAG: PKD domain-containing protein [Methanosarcina sp.]